MMAEVTAYDSVMALPNPSSWTIADLMRLKQEMLDAMSVASQLFSQPKLPLTATQQRMATDALTYGKYRIPASQAHSNSAGGTSNSAGGAVTQSIDYAKLLAWNPHIATKPAEIPYAGVRTGEIIGHRLWLLHKLPHGEVRLGSLAHMRIWEPNETVHGDLDREVDLGIFGGTYAFNDPTHVLREFIKFRRKIADLEFENLYPHLGYHFGSIGVVMGTIKMWGNVIEHEKGYRAEYAKLHSLDDYYGDIDFQQFKRYYGV